MFPFSIRTCQIPMTALQSSSMYLCLHCILVLYNLTWLWNLKVAWPIYCICCKTVYLFILLVSRHSHLKLFVSSRTSTGPWGWRLWSAAFYFQYKSLILTKMLNQHRHSELRFERENAGFAPFPEQQKHKQWERGLRWFDVWNIFLWQSQMWPNLTVKEGRVI